MNTTTPTEYPIATRWEIITGEAPPAPAETYLTITVDDSAISLHRAGSWALLFRDVEDFEEMVDGFLSDIRRDLVGLKLRAEVTP